MPFTRPHAGADESTSLSPHRAPAPSMVLVMVPGSAFGHRQGTQPATIPPHDALI